MWCIMGASSSLVSHWRWSPGMARTGEVVQDRGCSNHRAGAPEASILDTFTIPQLLGLRITGSLGVTGQDHGPGGSRGRIMVPEDHQCRGVG
jgi:hypothetical protein